MQINFLKINLFSKLFISKAVYSRFCKRRGTLFILWLSWLAVEVFSPWCLVGFSSMKNKSHNIFCKSLNISLYMFTFLFWKFPLSTLCPLLASGSGISSTHGLGICRHWSVSVVSLVSLGTHLPKFFALLCSVAIDKKFQSQHHTEI